MPFNIKAFSWDRTNTNLYAEAQKKEHSSGVYVTEPKQNAPTVEALSCGPYAKKCDTIEKARTRFAQLGSTPIDYSPSMLHAEESLEITNQFEVSRHGIPFTTEGANDKSTFKVGAVTGIDSVNGLITYSGESGWFRQIVFELVPSLSYDTNTVPTYSASAGSHKLGMSEFKGTAGDGGVAENGKRITDSLLKVAGYKVLTGTSVVGASDKVIPFAKDVVPFSLKSLDFIKRRGEDATALPSTLAELTLSYVTLTNPSFLEPESGPGGLTISRATATTVTTGTKDKAVRIYSTG